MDFGLGKRNQRRCILSCTVLSVGSVSPTGTPSLCSHFWHGKLTIQELAFVLSATVLHRTEDFHLDPQGYTVFHLLHSELRYRQINPAQGPVSGTFKGSALFQVCKSYFGKPLWHFGAYLLGCDRGVLTPWCLHLPCLCLKPGRGTRVPKADAEWSSGSH